MIFNRLSHPHHEMVYHHIYYDYLTDEVKASKFKIPMAQIKEFELKPMLETAQIVKKSDLDDYGRFNPDKR